MNQLKINIAHEAPIEAMPHVQRLTDYDYALSVLFDKVDGYYDFFKSAIKNGRYVLLDNGVFENGVSMDNVSYVNWIDKLTPDEYIVPDVLSDKDKTIESFENWNKEYKDLAGKKIGVVQGSTFEETVECYKYMSAHADKIAIPFALKWYYDSFTKETNKWQGASLARLGFFDYLRARNILNYEKPHHILGANLPTEFQAYGPISCIESIDTSNPVVYAILKGRYPNHITGIGEKITTKLKDLITTKCDEKLIADICFNIAQFKIQNNL
jgi:hypothetical protein